MVEFREGRYSLDSTLILSGIRGPKIIFRPYENEKAIISGSKELNDFTHPDDEFLGQLAEHAKKEILQFDIGKIGLINFGLIGPRGFPMAQQPSPMELFIDDIPLNLARWPNRGYANISGVEKGRYGDQFNYSDDKISSWDTRNEIWLHGFWAVDWADSYVKIIKIDTELKAIITAKPYGTYGYIKSHRFYGLNILEELDESGEWYFNNKRGKLLFWPPKTTDSIKVTLSVLMDPLLLIDDSEQICWRGIVFQDTRGTGIKIVNSNSIELGDLVVRNTGNRGIDINRSNDVVIHDCEIYHTGEGGVYASGGERASLNRADIKIINNEIHHTNRWVISYSPGIQIDGVGQVIRNNFIHDIPHMAIRFSGNNHIIDYNEISGIGFETGDAGAIYTGRDWTMRGTMIRYNYLHDIQSKYYRGMAGIYLDDFGSGALIEGNIFRNIQTGIILGGGRDNIINNNIFDLVKSIPVRVEVRLTKGTNIEGQMKKLLFRMPYQDSIWSLSYPELVNILEKDPYKPMNNAIENNIAINSSVIEIPDYIKSMQTFNNNETIIDSLEYPNVLSKLRKIMNENLKDQIPLDRIGLRK
ncbi:MAG TPA: right-handed parallel beta-helix repeat-containing protein [Cyclobacteriaceae bacterium]|nr:right-handed parallel beta-helix repeat-containing protein [Cyclobacteriaceae bacterium]